MPRYHVTLTDTEIQELKSLIQKGGKGYRIKHAQILLTLDQKPENRSWTYDRIKEAYGASHSTIAGIAQRFVTESMESALGRKEQKNRHRKKEHLFYLQRHFPFLCLPLKRNLLMDILFHDDNMPYILRSRHFLFLLLSSAR